jgi:hypothetical protein
MAIEKSIDHRHRTRQRPFDRPVGLRAQELRIVDEDRLRPRYGTDYRRHARIVAIANPDDLALVEIDSAEMFDEGRDEMLARLFAVSDDIDPGLPLIIDGQSQGILLAGRQLITLQLPRRPERPGLCKPGRFGQTARGGGR